ncbi:4-hydroxyphenylpyruvate dioxygenase [Streptomyces sp. NPDC047079]|uniref:4-hydroxyphenylpyruvate dioxygenase n=1 Tax=Streptomyces sp. NPDC047079 TaxID=3154607 RepID=UPI0033EB11BA
MHDIAYLEFSATDHGSVVDYFTRSFGFTEAAFCEEPHRSSTLLRQGDVRIVVTSGPATETYLAAHGDGVSDVAFFCTDIPAALERAEAAGARRLGPTMLSGFGDVRHTLVQRSPETDANTGYPDDRAWVASAARPGPATEGFIRELDHLAILVPHGTLQDTVHFYENGFDLKQYSSEYVEVGAQAMDSIVVRSGSGKVTFTIIEPDATRQTGQVDGFLSRNAGAGVQHPAFLVDDVVGAVRRFRERGVRFLSTPDAYYQALTERVGHLQETIEDLRDTNVLADRDEWGYLLQLFTESPYERNTLFFELIQRHGAQGFGAGNIKALYESVERERGSGA